MSGPIIYVNPNAPQVFGSGTNPFQAPEDKFPSGTPVTPQADQPELLGEGAAPVGAPAFGAGSPVTPTGNDPEFLGATETLPNAELFGSGTPPSVTADQSEETGKNLFYGDGQPFVFGSGNIRSPTTDDPIFEGK